MIAASSRHHDVLRLSTMEPLVAAEIVQRLRGDVGAPFLEEVTAVGDDERLAAIADERVQLAHDFDAEHRIRRADGHERLALPLLRPELHGRATFRYA